MELTGLHVLLTYQCNLECDHCFVWSHNWQKGTLTISQLDEILDQAQQVPSIRSVFFEGGEPFLYYALLKHGVERAKEMGYTVGIVSNAYWATSEADAVQWLKPLAGKIDSLSVSSDLYHWNEELAEHAETARAAAEELGINIGVIAIAQPEVVSAESVVGTLPDGGSRIMFRGRAAEKLAAKVQKYPAAQFTTCPHEKLASPSRVHVDPLGYLHVCQGISMGNLFAEPLKTICDRYDPEGHPVIGPLIAGGPVELADRYGVGELQDGYADACELCYRPRTVLRDQYPAELAPDQMYGA